MSVEAPTLAALGVGCLVVAAIALRPTADPAVPPCGPLPAPQGGHLTIATFRGPGVPPGLVDAQVARARATLAELGVRLETSGPTGTVDARWVLGSGAADADDLDALTVAVTRPARDLVATLPPLDPGVVPVVVLAQVMAADSPLRAELTRMRAWTATDPALLGREAGPPVVFLSAEDLVFAPGTVDVTLAHELAHARGLDHVGDPHNLLYDGDFSCRPVLRPDQLSAFSG